jgi:hypothetical protein
MNNTQSKLPWFTRAMNHFRVRPDHIFLCAFLLPLFVFALAFFINYFDFLGPYPKIKETLQTLPPSLITSLIIIFSAFLAASFAIEGMNTAKTTACLQETLKMIREAELDGEFIGAKNAWTKYRSLRERDNTFAALMSIFYLGFEGVNQQENESSNDRNAADDKDRKENFTAIDRQTLRNDAQFILAYFNFFEIAALSMSEGILDDVYFRKWYGTNFIRVWNNSIGAIGALRTLHNNERLYTEWENRAYAWSIETKAKVRDPIYYGSLELANITREAIPHLHKLAREEGERRMFGERK